MIKIDFVPSSMKQPTEKQLSLLDRASEMDLRYDYFPVNISLNMRGFEKEEFPCTPALDFTFCILLAVEKLSRGDAGRISFTENDLSIDLVPDDAEVTLKRSWDPEVATCSFGDLIAASREFCGDVINFIAHKYPRFRENPFFSKLKEMQAELSSD
ncbi:hypothetical protein [Streptomyces sp. SAS_272]|uniref:hypothetical protein n=1 Tax=Streptomyces sp. SAS_272 TaxID=3412747 RepID=UPI00403C176C